VLGPGEAGGSGSVLYRKAHKEVNVPNPYYLRSILSLILGGFASCCVLSAPPPAQEATDYATHFNRGQELLRQMRFHESNAEFREAARLNPQYLPAQQALAVTYALNQNFVMSWKQVRLLRQSHVDVPKEFLQQLSASLSEAEAAKQEEDIEKNLTAAQKAAVEHSDNPALLAALGTALNKAGDYPAAQRAAYQALQLDPNQPEAHFLLGSILGGEPPTSEEAIPHLKVYLQNVPRTPESTKDVTQAYRVLGDLYRRSGREQQALQNYEEGLRTAPDEASILNNAAWTYASAQDASLRNPERALAYARKAVALSKGEKAIYLDTLAEALYANCLFDEAVATEKKALSMEPQSEFYPDQLKKFQAAQRQAQQSSPKG